MADTLANLAGNQDFEDLKYLRKVFGEEDAKLLAIKGVFPYDYMNSVKKLDKKSLQSKQEFNSKLYDEHITNEDCEYAKNYRNTLR